MLRSSEVPWGSSDVVNLGLVIGNSASQALAEFLSVLFAVVVWKHRLVAGCSFQVHSDSTAALWATDKLEGKSPITDFLSAALALGLEIGRRCPPRSRRPQQVCRLAQPEGRTGHSRGARAGMPERCGAQGRS